MRTEEYRGLAFPSACYSGRTQRSAEHSLSLWGHRVAESIAPNQSSLRESSEDLPIRKGGGGEKTISSRIIKEFCKSLRDRRKIYASSVK